MLSGLSFYLVPKLLASDLILTVDAAAGKAGIWPGGSLQNSEFISGDTFLLPTCLRGRDKRAPLACASALRFVSITDTAPARARRGHAHARTRTTTPPSLPGDSRDAVDAAKPRAPGPGGTHSPPALPALVPPPYPPPAPAFPGAAGTGRSFNPLLAATPIPGLAPSPNPPAPTRDGATAPFTAAAAVSVGFPPWKELFLRGSRARPDPGRVAAHGPCPHPGPAKTGLQG